MKRIFKIEQKHITEENTLINSIIDDQQPDEVMEIIISEEEEIERIESSTDDWYEPPVI